MTTPTFMNTTGTSHLPDRSTSSMIFLCDPSQEATTHQTTTSSANTATVTALDAGPIVQNRGV